MTEDLNKLSASELGLLFPIIISDYNPDWSEMYLDERKRILLSDKKKNILRIEHIGSTSVPGLCAKPTIDILIELAHDTDCESFTKSLAKINYQLIPKPENPPPHIMLAKGYTNTGITGQTYHIHLRYTGDWDEIYFRDYLINNPVVALSYGNLKKELSIKYKNDREEYTSAKTEFIKQINQIARGKSTR
jgi:GrpB-like predicted nucleotidyltransferase (UPF0157 family)